MLTLVVWCLAVVAASAYLALILAAILGGHKGL